MTDSQQQQLIRQITEQVLAMLRNRSGPADVAASRQTHTMQARVHPPAGVCTGDYSKFADRPDLSRRSAGAPAPTAPDDRLAVVSAISGTRADPKPPPPKRSQKDAPSSAAESAGPVLQGFVTARRIEQLGRSVIRLSSDARLTPLAQDLVKHKSLTIERVNHQSGNPPATKLMKSLWWIDGQCPIFDELTGRQGDAATVSPEPAKADRLVTVIRNLATQIRQRRIDGGILFVTTAARAGAYANRCRSLRAVVGTCEQAVRDAIDQLAANVLIIEYRRRSAMQMRAMVETFVSRPRPDLKPVARDLSELSRCG